MSDSVVTVSSAVEGDLDEAVLSRVIEFVGLRVGRVYGKNGKRPLRTRMRAFNQAAQFGHWCVLVDLDHDARCAAALRADWLPSPAPLMRFRVAVREVEAWLLGDAHRLAEFLRVQLSRVPTSPESEESPKEAIVGLARRSRLRDIREDMVPRPGSERTVGVGYTSRLIEFVTDTNDGWRPGVAASNANSLERCIARLKEFV